MAPIVMALFATITLDMAGWGLIGAGGYLLWLRRTRPRRETISEAE
jgi:hypothetical protein